MPLSNRPWSPPPRYQTLTTPGRPNYGAEINEVSSRLGTLLMPWQRTVADVATEYDPDTGLFYYRNVIITVPRQSGKTTLLESLVLLLGLMFPKYNMRYTAQTGADARKKLFDDWLPALTTGQFKRYLSARMTNGHEQLVFNQTKSRLGLVATTQKSGHGSTVDLALLDEAFAHKDARLEQALVPAMATRPNAQLWIVSTAGTPEDSPYLLDKVTHGRQLTLEKVNYGTCYFEWSAPDGAAVDDPVVWRDCMPALGRTINEDVVRAAMQSMSESEFRRAFLNQWVASLVDPVIPLDVWAKLVTPSLDLIDPVAIGLDVSPERDYGCIAAAGRLANGNFGVEIIHSGEGTGWMAKKVAEIWHKHRPVGIYLDRNGPVGSLVSELQVLNVPLVEDMPPSAHAKACGLFYDGCMRPDIDGGPDIRHLDQSEFVVALDGAVKRPMGDSWVWNRKASAVNITPIVAATMAYWGIKQHSQIPQVYDLAEIIARKQAGNVAPTKTVNEPASDEPEEIPTFTPV